MNIKLTKVYKHSIELQLKKRIKHGAKVVPTNAMLLAHYSLESVNDTFLEKATPIGNGFFKESKGNTSTLSDVTKKDMFVSKNFQTVYFCKALGVVCEKIGNKYFYLLNKKQVEITIPSHIDSIRQESRLIEKVKAKISMPKTDCNAHVMLEYTENVNSILASACKLSNKLDKGKHRLNIKVTMHNDKGLEVLRKPMLKANGKIDYWSKITIGDVEIQKSYVCKDTNKTRIWFTKETIERYKYLAMQLSQLSLENMDLLTQD
jgi:hypothetical protein